MTTSANIPAKFLVPWAQGDVNKVEVPVTTASPTNASQTLGFPPLTMQPPEVGGVPPKGEEFNGGMNQIARIAWWMLFGSGFPYDAAFATSGSIGGYPNGARLPTSDYLGTWLSIADSNTNNPDTNGANWLPGRYRGAIAISVTSGTTTLTQLQANKMRVFVNGTLSGNVIIVMPAWAATEWIFFNQTSGAFTVTVKTAAGGGIVIPQNGAPTEVYGDGTNIVLLSNNVALALNPTQAVQYSQVRIKLTTATTFYVSPAGSDVTGTGTIGNPWQSLTFAYTSVQNAYDAAGFTITFNCTAGAYAPFTCANAIVGQGLVVIVGNGSTITVTTSAVGLINITGTASATVSGFTLSATGAGAGSTGVFAGNGGTVALGAGMVFGVMTTGAHMAARTLGVLTSNVNYSITGGAGFHILATSGTIAVSAGTATLTGTPAFATAFARATSGALINYAGAAISGAATGARYVVELNSVMSVGGSATFFPGSVAGLIATGGQYA